MVAEHMILRFKLESQKLGNDGLDSFLHRDAAVKNRPKSPVLCVLALAFIVRTVLSLIFRAGGDTLKIQ